MQSKTPVEGSPMTPSEAAAQMRALTVQALREATAGFAEFDRRIDACSAAFEDGEDARGRSVLAGMVEPLAQFAGFCNAVLRNCAAIIAPETAARVADANCQFEQALQTVVSEAEGGNVSGIADACRIDLAAALAAYRQLFPTLADELEQA